MLLAELAIHRAARATLHSRGKDNLLIHAPKLSVSNGSYLANEAVSAVSNIEFRPWPPVPAFLSFPPAPPPHPATSPLSPSTPPLHPPTRPPTHNTPVKKLREPLSTKLTYLYTCIFISARNQIETVHEQQAVGKITQRVGHGRAYSKEPAVPNGVKQTVETRMQEEKWKACSLKGKNTFGVEIF